MCYRSCFMFAPELLHLSSPERTRLSPPRLQRQRRPAQGHRASPDRLLSQYRPVLRIIRSLLHYLGVLLCGCSRTMERGSSLACSAQ